MDITHKSKDIVLSGMRPTGLLHLGHFEAVLNNWINLQNNHQCFYFVADWHAITTNTDTKHLREYTISIVKDWLAYGISPDKSAIFVQSLVPQHAELSLVLERLVKIGALFRLPTFKSYVQNLSVDRKVKDENGNLLPEEELFEKIAKAEVSAGFLTYPVLQAADILLYDTTLVPVGEDQLPHIELTRTLARTFNGIYGDLFKIPEALLDSNIILIRGTDGRKMSKSLENDISPTDTLEEISSKIKLYVSNRVRLTDNGSPFDCPVYDLHRAFNQDDELGINKSCREASIRCMDCKMALPALIYQKYSDYRNKLSEISDEVVLDILTDGSRKAREIADAKMQQVREFMLINYLGDK